MRNIGKVLGFGLLLTANIAFAAGGPEAMTPKDKASYAIGMDMARSLKRNGVEVNADVLGKAIKDVLVDNKVQLTDDEAKVILAGLQKEMQGKQQEKMKMLGEENQKDGAAFLVEKMKRDGVKTLPSGLQYKVITEGTGKSPSATDTVTVQYKGSLIDGTEFDSSYKRGQPATSALNGVIKGWTEALQPMKEGSKWQISFHQILPMVKRERSVGQSGRMRH